MFVDADMKQLLDAMSQQSAAAHEETRRQFVVVSEGLRHELQIVAEGVSMNSETLRRLEGRIEQIASDLENRVTFLEASSSRGSR